MEPETTSARFANQAKAGLSGLQKVFAGFKEFISRGNAVELAVGVAIGAAFGAVVTGLTNGFIGPLVALVLRGRDLSKSLGWNWLGTDFSAGLVLDALLKFAITAAAIYFFVVVPLNAWARRRAKAEEPEPEPLSEDTELLREIRDLLAARTGVTALRDRPGIDETATDEDAANPPGTLPPSFPPGT